STIEGAHVKLYTLQRSSQEVDVCFRVDDSSLGVGSGGEVVITDALPQVGGVGLPTLGVPSVDNNSSACSSTSGNLVPGSHPVASGQILGFSYLFDTYLNNSAAWVCLQ